MGGQERNPMVDPQEGDVLYHKFSELSLLVDYVEGGWIYFRVVLPDGGLYNAARVTLEKWRELAPQQGKL